MIRTKQCKIKVLNINFQKHRTYSYKAMSVEDSNRDIKYILFCTKKK